MTQEKLRRTVTAAVVAATITVFCLLVFIAYQVVTLIVQKNRIKELKKDISEYEQVIEEDERDLEYYLTQEYLENAARRYGGTKVQEEGND